jgi:uroporphyrinogen decarboxylase
MESALISCKERVIAALTFCETPFVPYSFGCAAPVWEQLKQHYGIENPFLDLGMHILAVEPRPPAGFSSLATAPGDTVDEFGVLWRGSPYGTRYPVGHPLVEPTLAAYHWPDPVASSRFDHILPIINAHSDRFIVAAISSCLFERAHLLRGFQELLTDLVLRPNFVHELLERILTLDLAILGIMLQFPVDGVWLGDDYGHQSGLILSPQMWRTFIKPRLGRLIEQAKRAGLPVFLHSDGAIAPLIPDLLEIGVDAINPLAPEMMDLAWLKREYGHDLCFCGGISAQRVLSRGTPNEVEAELRQKVRLLACGGGYIVATAGSVQADVPLPNLARLLDLLRAQDKEPLNSAGAN